MRWAIDARWNQMRRTFKQEEPDIVNAIMQTKVEAGILWGCRASAVEVTSASLVFEGPRITDPKAGAI